MKNKKIFAVTAAVLMGTMTVSAFSGCGGTIVEDSSYDPTKANLSVATFDGGVGRAWLEEAALRFEELYKDSTEFEEGKVGVKVSVVGDKDKYAGNKLAEAGSLDKDVYFTEAVDYYDFVNKGLVADLSDVVKGDMSAYGEDGKIEDKIDTSIKGFMTAKDGNYYMLPFYDGYMGFIYDVELFEKEGFYLDKDGDFIGIEDDGFATNKGAGPDGVEGTYDDGLPATYQQFIDLCDQIVGKGCVPFCYSGNYPDYVNKSFYAFAADYEGYDSFMLNKTFYGTTKIVESIVDDGSLLGKVTLKDVTITKDNGYDLQKQAGKYYALRMQEELFGTPKYLKDKVYNGLDYTVAQGEFIKSKYTNQPYAMLVEGVWWENEANPTFLEIEANKGAGHTKMDRRFGFMPLPKVNEDHAGKATLYSVNSSFGFVNKNAENMKLAKEFMRFLHTDAEMSKFSAKTSIPRSLKYSVNAEDMKTATNFGKSLMTLREKADVAYPFSSLDFVINHQANFDNSVWLGTASVGGKPYGNAFNAFKNGNATAKTFFEGLWTYQQSGWSTNSR